MLTKIAVPAGKCPITLDDPTREGVIEWAQLVRAKGLKTDRHYMVEALVWWSREFDCVDPRDVKEWLIEEWPNERPLSAREWSKLMVDKGLSKEAKAARKEAKSTEPKPEPAPKVVVERDAFGNRVGSQANIINVAFLAGHRTSGALCKATGLNSGRMAGHLKFLVENKFATKVGDEYIPTDPNAAPTIEGEKPTAKPVEKTTRAKYTVFGLPAAAVCRTLGAKKWEFDAMTLALETLGCKGMSHATMRMHYVAGQKKNNRWGEPAKLTKKQLDKLTEAAK